ncbi:MULTISPECIES: hypothetical protein [Nocardia]|uniref:hypothetical protein n=1 Tax=Nocardia TaxID=1817 RepID=UPI00030AAD86|nr:MULTISPECIES: hypothetical protein [Nocardia]
MAALLAAVLLVVPMVDCSTARAHAHTHASVPAGVEHFAHSISDHANAVVVDVRDGHCVAHVDHCVAKSVLRAPENFAPQHVLLFALASALVVAVGIRGTAAGGVRGPPIAWGPIAGGRATLTQFCIARR